MIRYRLDDLGWYQFEWLVQSLLKADLGIGVESWGGHHDYGRDAFAKGPLRFPGVDPTDGPFIFQAKFVDTANAAGADADPIVLDAVRKEAVRIRARQASPGPPLSQPRHYVLLTNAPLDAALKSKIASVLSAELPTTEVTPLGGTDVCDRLDAHPNIRKAFPQLLGLRDLDELLKTALTQESRERSQSAIEAARDLAPVFVPTRPYDNCWEILQKHRFAVLEGPPEMGKTAIAWMIGLAQLAAGWEVIACDAPDHVYNRRESSTSQVFIADDAFGRTEYDASRGRRWENDLDRILRLIDSKHWLIWTSRKHILERALRSLDLQGKAAGFPKPAEVLVEASSLSTREKALILYRHARARNLEAAAKEIVRAHARTITEEPSFTPERIRRFVQETLPDLPPIIKTDDKLLSWRLKAEREKAILNSIRNPTVRMRRSFQGLPNAGKWLLISLLEAGSRCPIEMLAALYRAHCPPEFRSPAEPLIDELTESFVAVATEQYWDLDDEGLAEKTRRVVDWIHPSYRDVIIDELSREPQVRERFLATMSLPGLMLAISDAGGATGQRYMPLMIDAHSWELLADRSVAIARSGDLQTAVDLIEVLTNACEGAVDPNTRDQLASILGSVCASCVERWDVSGVALTAEQIDTFASATLICSPMPRMPSLDESWRTATNKVEANLQSEDFSFFCPGEGGFQEWAGMARAIDSSEPRLLRRHRFPAAARYRNLIETVISRLDDESS
jgi:hypothetical protein